MTRRRPDADKPPAWVTDPPAPQAPATWDIPDWMRRPRPCTEEEQWRALQLVKGVLGRELTLEQGQASLRALFGGREQEL